MSSNLQVDWSKLPQPVDDGGADHLVGTAVAEVSLQATNGKSVQLVDLKGRSVIYIYPMTAQPDTPLPDDWDFIPGARGCTPQSCAFRDHYDDLKQLGVDHLYGMSTQATKIQQEAKQRLHLPFELLTDSGLNFAKAMNLPTFKVDNMTLLRRLTLIMGDGVIEAAFYPVFPPDQSVQDVMKWLSDNPRAEN